MDRLVRNLLGLLDDGKRVYLFHEDEVVAKEEFEYAKIIHGIVFGEKGYCETLGPSWNMVHDPRFLQVELAFVSHRRALFGGDTRLGKQYISDTGVAESTIADLEQYSEMIAEGRHFGEVLQKATSNTQAKFVHPRDLYKQSDEYIWDLIRQECPNYWIPENMNKPKEGPFSPNLLANILFKAMKADLVGLVYDYSTVANVQEWVLLDTGDVVEDAQRQDPETKQVWLEIDLLEKALSQRATLRCTAAKILDTPAIRESLRFANINLGKNVKLTDLEMDGLLQLIYSSSWPDDVMDLCLKINGYLINCASENFEIRQGQQLRKLELESSNHCKDLKAGRVQPITRYTDPEVEIELTAEQVLINEILHNPLKQSLYLLYTDAEREGWQPIVDRLKPIFAEPDYPMDMDDFTKILQECEQYIPEDHLSSIEETVEEKNQAVITDPEFRALLPTIQRGANQLDADISKEMFEHEFKQEKKPN